MRRTLAATALAAALTAGSVPVIGPTAPAAAQTIIEGQLPPGTQQVLAALRVFKGLSARNRVYREAVAVQRDLRAYYSARIETAQQQLVNRRQLGLRESQVQAYTRVKARLEAERDAALAITEDEKHGAKLAFESRLRQQVLPLLAETRKGRQAVGKLKETAEDLRAALQRAQEASDLRAALSGIEQRIARLEQLAELAELLPGEVGRRMAALVAQARQVVDEAGAGIEQATAAAGAVIERLDAAVNDLDAQTARRPVTDQDAVGQALDAVLERIFAPGGQTPTADMIAAAILGGLADPHLLQNLGIATGVLDPEDLATMSERVRGALLRETMSRIARQCGRLTGALQRAAVDAALAGDDLPEAHPPCALLRDPDRLAALLDEFGRPAAAEDPEVADFPELPRLLPDGVYIGEFDFSGNRPRFGSEVHQADIRLEVAGDHYRITVFVEYTQLGPGSPPCESVIRATYDGIGVRVVSSPSSFRGHFSRTVSNPDCPGPEPKEDGDFLLNVWVHDDPPSIEGRFDGRTFWLTLAG